MNAECDYFILKFSGLKLNLQQYTEDSKGSDFCELPNRDLCTENSEG